MVRVEGMSESQGIGWGMKSIRTWWLVDRGEAAWRERLGALMVDRAVGSAVGPCLINIVDSVFTDCDSLKVVNLPDSLTSLGDEAFDGHVKLGPPTHPLLVQKSEDENDNTDEE